MPMQRWTLPTAAALAAFFAGSAARAVQRPNTMESCKLCHKPAEGVVRGRLVSVSPEFKSLSVTVGSLVWLVRYGDDLKVLEGEKISGPDALKALPRDREVAVTFTGSEAKPSAVQLAVKQPYKVPEAKLVSVEKMKALVAQGPAQGGFFLFDARPAPMYAEGHIPGALSLPYAQFKEKAAAALPSDKAAPIIFYCAGETCTLGPFSAREAEKLGYSNVKVFHGGMPAWKKAGGLVITSAAALETWAKAGDPVVLVDLREAGVAQQGFIPGAVGIPAKSLAAWKDKFPENKKAPVVLYGAAQASEADFATVRGWGYANTSVLENGRAGWTGESKTGPLAARIDYVKRLKPGEISIDEFKKLADARPKGVLIVDVREQPVDGVLAGALSVPESQLEARSSEIPKVMDVVLHCNTGILAKKAYDFLAAKGYTRVRYLNAVIVVGPKGAYEVTEK